MSEIMTVDKAEMKKLSDIKPYDNNPRKNDKTVDLLCEMIPKVGFNVPLVIDEDGVIVKGHARYLAAKRLGMKKVPCVTTHADKDAIKADRIADNKVQEFSKWNNEELMHEVDMLDLEYDFTDMGLPRATFDDFVTVDGFDDFETKEPDKASLEEKRARYLKMLEDHAAETTEEVSIVSERDLKKAKTNQREVPYKQKEYMKCTCKQCGHVFYFDKNTYYDKNGTTKR